MLGLAWSEIAVIGVVALIAIGPKDLPVAIKAITEMLKKARRMASEFQGHVDEMVRDANLHEVRDQIKDIRSMDIKGRILKAVDGDGALQRTISGAAPYTPTPAAPLVDTYVPELGPAVGIPLEHAAPEPDRPPAPAMIPPGIAAPMAAPAFIPPGDATRAPTYH